MFVQLFEGGSRVYKESWVQRHLFHQGAVQCRAPFSSSVPFQTIPPLYSNPSNLHSSQHRAGVDGVQHPEYAVQSGSFLVGGPFRLHPQEWKNDIFSMFSHILSLQLVTNLPDLNKGGAKGHVLVRDHGLVWRNIRKGILAPTIC